MKKYIVTYLLLLFTILSVQAQEIRYVKTDGAYSNDGKSWATAKNNVQDAINDLYDYMQKNNLNEGRVYVAAGRYTPTESTESTNDGIAYTAFKIYEGITLYGGFNATNPEVSPEKRRTIVDGGNSWEMVNETILDGNHTGEVASNVIWNADKQQFVPNFSGSSFHVVWFATKGFTSERANGLSKPAGLDGFTIRGGYSSNRAIDGRHHNSFGAGVYMVENSAMTNCIVTHNVSTRQGGGVYLDGGGEVDHCFIRYNQCLGVGIVDGFGGGVAIDGGGIVRHSLVVENVARMGGGVALLAESLQDEATRYASAAMGCVVANNTTTTEAGGVYMRYGGVINHLTVVNNRCNGRNIIHDGHRYGRSAGVYVDQYGQIFNSVCWGGEVQANENIQYAAYTVANQDETPFVHYSAFAKNDITDWSGTTRFNVIGLADDNGNPSVDGYYPEFMNPSSTTGVGIAADENPRWQPYAYSVLKGSGVMLLDYDYALKQGDKLVHARLDKDMYGTNFVSKTTQGAFVARSEKFLPAMIDGRPTLFVDPSRKYSHSLTANPDVGIGNSWDNPLGNLNDALLYFSMKEGKEGGATEKKKGRILVKEGELKTTGNYMAGRLRANSLMMANNVEVYGGYPATLTGIATIGRDPIAHPTHISGNIANDDYDNNVHHLVRFQDVSNAVLDGFRLYYGNAYSTNLHHEGSKHGGGVIVFTYEKTQMSGNALRNCIIANCTAIEGGAIFITGLGSGGEDDSVAFSMENCIIHNNESKSVSGFIPSAICVRGSGTQVDINHCTMRGNIGYAVATRNNAKVTINNSVIHANANKAFNNIAELKIENVRAIYAESGSISGSYNLLDKNMAVPTGGNTSNQAILSYVEGDANYPSFVNPTRNVGVSEAVDNTLYGGYPNFMPENMTPLVNAANGDGNATDITTICTRNYGGLPDVGAVENTDLPANGTVYYVRKSDGNDSDTGLSWDNAFATVGKALEMAEASNGVCKQIWVAAGTYPENLTMVDGVNVYGGFIANGNPGMNDGERDISNMNTFYQTIIDGQAKDRVLDQGDNFANETMWEGFTFQNGKTTYPSSNSYYYLSTITTTTKTETTYDPEVAKTWDSYTKTKVECNAGDEFAFAETIREVTSNVTDDYEEVRTQTTTKTNDYEEESISRSDWLKAIGNDNDDRKEANSRDNAKLKSDYGYYGESPLQQTYTLGTYGNAQFTLKDNTLTVAYRTSKSGTYKTITYDCDHFTYSNTPGNNRTYTITTHKYNNYKKVTYYTTKTTYYQTITRYYRYKYSREVKTFTKSPTKNQSFTDYQRGGGVRLFYNGTLKNCLITRNEFETSTSVNGVFMGGGGVYMREGSVVKNCIISMNKATVISRACAAGVYSEAGTFVNSLIVENVVNASGYDCRILGAGLFVGVQSNLYSCTIAYNEARNGNSSDYATTGGVWDDKAYYWNGGTLYKGTPSNFYNCIFWGNAGFSAKSSENYQQIGYSGFTSLGTSGIIKDNFKNCYHAVPNSKLASDNVTDNTVYLTNSSTSLGETYSTDFVNACKATNLLNADYSININSALAQYCINMGSDDGADILENTYGITQDIAGADRVQDCTIDKGAYEYNGAKDITADITTTNGVAYYYVTQNGRGTATAESPANAACWEKLQKVLDAAGLYKYKNPEKQVVVKLAAFPSGGYMPRRSAVTSSSVEASNPRTYSIQVPRGVEVWGGYTDDYTSTTNHGFLDKNRNVMTNRTTLNGCYQASGQDVNVYHVVTFTDLVFDTDGKVIANQRLSDKAGNMGHYNKAVLDGLHITGGMANGINDDDRRGGAAIVTDYAHVRNCIVKDNYAVDEGGAFYMKPNSLISGTLLKGNSTDGAGGAIFVEEPTTEQKAANSNAYARLFTSTIVNNSAGQGGGIGFETNLRANSVVVWSNDANAQANVSGQLDPFSTQVSTTQTVEDYPMSFCAVENLRVAGINNLSVESNANDGVRFADEDYYALKAVSVLGRAGMRYQYYETLMSSYPTLSKLDFAHVDRINQGNNFIDIGARAYPGSLKTEPTTDNLLTRLYVVSPELIDNLDIQNTLLDEGGDIYKQQGSSFANPMSHLDDALEDIRDARKNIANVNNTKFEIFISGGIFYPKQTVHGELSNSRANTFLVPEGVTIIGGMDPNGLGTSSFYGQDTGTETIEGVTLKSETTEAMRKGRAHFDLNDNNIIEPWEMEHQTILSGHTVNSVKSENVYHVITAIAAEEWVGALPTGTITGAAANDGSQATVIGERIILDGLNISDGEAYGYEPGMRGNKHSYYHGGAICVDGNWVSGSEKDQDGKRIDEFKYTNVANPVGYRNIPMTVMNCQFTNNMAGMGGAIFSNGDLEIYGCSFTQNYSVGGSDTHDDQTVVSYTGNGGAVNASATLVLVNSLFANNEAQAGNYVTGGRGGAVLAGGYSNLYVMNCNFVRNYAKDYPAIYNYVANKGGTVKANMTEAEKATLRNDNPHRVVNSIFWGNEAEGKHKAINFGAAGQEKEHLWFCAYGENCGLTPVVEMSAVNYRTMPFNFIDNDNKVAEYIPLLFKAQNGNPEVTNNIILNSNNEALDGPNFINPSHAAGKNGYLASADWMMSRINNLVDNGWTFLNQQITTDSDGNYICNFVNQDNKAGSGVYLTVSDASRSRHGGISTMPYGEELYMLYPEANDDEEQMLRVSKDPNPTHTQSYIDIGVYEYHHVQLRPTSTDQIKDIIWVTQTERQDLEGPADGSSWQRATSDLQRAIETLLSGRNGRDKEIRIIEGEYMPIYTISGNLGFKISTTMANQTVLVDDTGNYRGIRSLTIRGGYSSEIEGVYDYAKYPVTLVASQRAGVSTDDIKHLFYVEDARQRTSRMYGETVFSQQEDVVIPIALYGLSFRNAISGNHTEGGAAFYYADQMKEDGSPLDNPIDDKRLTLNSCIFLGNGANTNVSAVKIGKGGGDALVYNCLFHSNTGDPMVAADTKVINCTFALNGGTVNLENAVENYASELHNSVLWRNNTAKAQGVTEVSALGTGVDYTHNAITDYKNSDSDTNKSLSSVNGDVFEGPNFVDPENEMMEARNFRIKPSAILLSQGDEALYATKVLSIKDNYRDAIAATTDLAYFTRLFGNGLDCGAYECQEALNRVIYVDPNKVTTSGDGRSWENAYGMNRLQNAIDAASVYIQTTTADSDEGQKDDEVFAYVFVKGKRDGSTGESITLRKGVQVYGSIDPGYTATAEISNDNTGDVVTSNIWAYEKKIRDERPGLAGTSTYRTIVESVTTTEEEVYDVQTVLDGFVVKASTERKQPVVNLQGDDNVQNALVMRNCIVAGNTVTDSEKSVVNVENGLLYNVLVQENNSGDNAPIVKVGTKGYIVNGTVVTNETGKKPINLSEDLSSFFINSIEATAISPFAPYFQPGTESYHKNKPAYLTDNHYLWYQLHEGSRKIDEGNDETTVKTTLPNELKTFINYRTDRDILGNKRLFNGQVDMGCFETWNINSDLELDHVPAEGSVVYVQEGVNLKLNSELSQTFSPSYLLLGKGASLYGQGARVELNYVAVEKEMPQAYSLLSLPYAYDFAHTVTATVDNEALTETPVTPTVHTYDGEARAAHGYHFVTDNSGCWTTQTGMLPANQGVLVLFKAEEAEEADKTYRFTGYAATASDRLYTEGGTETSKAVTLTQYNSTPTNGSAAFTSAENMGWNLVGMPYLVNRYATHTLADDTYQMHIPHVFYTLEDDGNYETTQSWEDGSTLSFGNAFFTQTATLDATEKLQFKLPVYVQAQAIDTRALLSITSEEGSDAVQLNPDESVEAMTDYQLNYDGAKLQAINSALPQLYALGNRGSRLSLVGSAPVEQEINLGFYAAQANEPYTFNLPHREAFANYSGVWLKDNQTGIVTNLLTEDYTLTTDNAGTYDNRLTLQIGGVAPSLSGWNDNARVIHVRDGKLRLNHLETGNHIRIFTVDGRLIQQTTAVGNTFVTNVPVGTYIIKVSSAVYKN